MESGTVGTSKKKGNMTKKITDTYNFFNNVLIKTNCSDFAIFPILLHNVVFFVLNFKFVTQFEVRVDFDERSVSNLLNWSINSDCLQLLSHTVC